MTMQHTIIGLCAVFNLICRPSPPPLLCRLMKNCIKGNTGKAVGLPRSLCDLQCFPLPPPPTNHPWNSHRLILLQLSDRTAKEGGREECAAPRSGEDRNLKNFFCNPWLDCHPSGGLSELTEPSFHHCTMPTWNLQIYAAGERIIKVQRFGCSLLQEPKERGTCLRREDKFEDNLVLLLCLNLEEML